MEKLQIVSNKIIEIYKKKLNIEPFSIIKDKTNNSYIIINYINIEKPTIIFIILDINILGLEELNLLRNKIVKELSEDINNKLNYFVISLVNYNNKINISLNDNGYACFYIYDIEYYKYENIYSYYLHLGSSMKHYEEVLSDIDKETIIKGEYSQHIVTDIIRKYLDINNIKKEWSDNDIQFAMWEHDLFLAVLKPEQSRYHTTEKFVGKTFAPMAIFKDKDGNDIYRPNIEEISKENGIQDYFFRRYSKTQNPLLKRRYLEVLVFWNSKLLSRPQCFINLIDATKYEIEWIKNNIAKYQYPEMELTQLYHRFIEIIVKYDATFSKDIKKDSYGYYLDYICNLYERKEYIYIIDMIENLFNYQKMLKDFIDSNYDTFVRYSEEALNNYRVKRDYIIEEHYIELISKLKRYKNEIYDKDKELAFSLERQANVRAKNSEFIVAVHFVEKAINLLQINKKDNTEKINELIALHKEWIPKSKKEFKTIEIKVPVNQEQLMHDRENYLNAFMSVEIKKRIEAFYCDYRLFMSEEFFNRQFEKTKNSLSSIMPTVIMDDIGTIVQPTNEEEQKTTNEFRWYSNIVQIDLNEFLFYFKTILERKIFTIEDIENYINTNITLEDEKQFIMKSFYFYKNMEYAASISLITPLFERFFREICGNDIKYKSGGVEYNISLDDMIKNSISNGFPPNIARFARFLLTRKEGMNIRNKLAHGLLDYQGINNKAINEMILWLIMFCCIIFINKSMK